MQLCKIACVIVTLLIVAEFLHCYCFRDYSHDLITMDNLHIYASEI